ncbi:acyl-CoA N-acyltransferase [Xylariales sp. AK1849]|nr:acyl-CoA N-acyltransferase [Xylariales sp. AK1849]
MAYSTIPTPPKTPAPGDDTLKRSSPAVSTEQRPVIFIGPASISDAPTMAALGAKTFTETFGHSISKEDLADFLAATYSAEPIAAELPDSSKATLVARDSTDNIVGIVQLLRWKTDPSVEGTAEEVAVLQKLYVDTSVHGRGIGSKQIWLTVWEENVKAQKLYQKLGYTKTGATEFVTRTCIQTDFVFAKRL